ncbi:hypothetical protein [Pseudoalteromonas luteoviolacea]|uniref:hypothetical protein n=1 Tax=Pseudoalteromonas luteoviolacea TaxID=43657 RepID=UPI001B37A347|nr:hypothetical protein [Pseudoalteromonas luteoviolacea]MBQ4836608.1 hypothetical protein [Pseudoalteromonas luteoviolacea]
MLKTIQKLSFIKVFLIAFSFFSGYAFSNQISVKETTNTYLVNSGEGFSVYEVSGTDYQEYASRISRLARTPASPGDTQSLESVEWSEAAQAVTSLHTSTRAYVFENLVGVMNSDLPYAVKVDILDDYDVTPNSDLLSVNTGLIVIDENFALETMKGSSSLLAVGGGSSTSTQSVNGDQTIRGFCKKRWHNRTKSDKLDITSLKKSADIKDNLTFTADTGIAGSINYSISYKYKTNRCSFKVPYKHSVTGFNAKGSLYSDNGKLRVQGTVIDTTNKFLYNESIKTFEKDLDFWVGPVRIVWFHELDLRARIRGGVKLEAEVDLNYNVSGKYEFDFVCEMEGENRCAEASKTVNTFQVDLSNPSVQAGVSVRARVQPEIAVIYKQGAGLYHKKLEVASLTLETALYSYAELWGYYGNSCGDGNYDGINETIGGIAIDAGVGVSAKYSWGVLGKDYDKPLKLKIIEGWVEVDVGAEDEDLFVMERSLFFKELVESDAFQPLITAPESIKSGNTQIKVAMRSCFPYTSNVTYKIEWGDGEVQEVTGSQGGLFVAHDFADYVSYPIRVTALKDSEGRDFRDLHSTREVFASPNGDITFNPGVLVAVLHSLL